MSLVGAVDGSTGTDEGQQQQEETTSTSEAEMIGSMLEETINYGVSVWKICWSCEELLLSGSDDGVTEAVQKYCDPNVYGYDAVQSSLVMVPIDPETDEFVQGNLRGIQSFRGTKVDVSGAPTPTATRAFNGDNDEFGLASLLEFHPEGAGAGSIVIAPDLVGYGSSLPTHNRTYTIFESYQQAAVVSWLSTKQWISEQSGGCTYLDDVVSMEGTSEGGYASLAASFAMRDIGVRILQVLAGVPFISHEAITVHIIDSYDSGNITLEADNVFFQAIVPLAVFSWSIGIPDLPLNQSMLSSNWSVPGNFDRNVFRWMESPDPIGSERIVELMPQYAPEIVNPSFVKLIQDSLAAGSKEPCTSFETSELVQRGVDEFCDAFAAMSLKPLMSSINYPTMLCYSDEDTIIPSFQFTDDVFDNSFVTRDLLFGNTSPIKGDHAEAGGLCFFNSIVYMLTGMTDSGPPTDPDQTPFLVVPLDESTQATCLNNQQQPTPIPSDATGQPNTQPGTENTTAGDSSVPPDSPTEDGDSSSGGGRRRFSACSVVFYFVLLEAITAFVLGF